MMFLQRFTALAGYLANYEIDCLLEKVIIISVFLSHPHTHDRFLYSSSKAKPRQHMITGTQLIVKHIFKTVWYIYLSYTLCNVTVIHWIPFVISNVMTTRYITLSAGTSNVMTTSVTTMQICIEINKL